MRRRAAGGWIAVTGLLLACASCGFKGPLYLPERNPTVVTHPRQAAQPAPAGNSKGKNAPPRLH
jgi:predicted small lipoprotein YifL